MRVGADGVAAGPGTAAGGAVTGTAAPAATGPAGDGVLGATLFAAMSFIDGACAGNGLGRSALRAGALSARCLSRAGSNDCASFPLDWPTGATCARGSEAADVATVVGAGVAGEGTGATFAASADTEADAASPARAGR